MRCRAADVRVQQLRRRAGLRDELYELPVYDVELAGRSVGIDDGETGRVERRGLQVLVEVGVFDRTDPEVS